MTVSSTTVKNSYSGDGSQTTFVYGYKIFADSDIKVIIRSATGTETAVPPRAVPIITPILTRKIELDSGWFITM